jgi:transcription antitermination factor NusG
VSQLVPRKNSWIEVENEFMATTILTASEFQPGLAALAAEGNGACNESSLLEWYAAYTYPRHEKQVAAHMTGRRVENFLPLYRSARRWKDRQMEIDLPLFPGYVFVHLALADRLKVLTVPGIVHLVSSRGRPAPLDETEMEVLRHRCIAGVRLEPHPYLSVGERVRVCSGPVAGLEGILLRRKDKFRVVLSIEMIMRSVAVEVDEADIEPLVGTWRL